LLTLQLHCWYTGSCWPQATGYNIAFNVAGLHIIWFGMCLVAMCAFGITVTYTAGTYLVDWSEEGVPPPFGSIRNLRPYAS